MHQLRSIWLSVSVIPCCALLLLSSMLTADETLGSDEAPPEAAEVQNDQTKSPDIEQRVILRINRNMTVNGVLELEDDDVLVVRTPRGEVRSFPKVRVLQIVRLVDPEPNQRGVVYLQNGQFREGVVLEDTFEHVLIEIEGIPAKLRREFVDFVVLEPTFEQRYEQFKASLTPRMHERYLALCRWLIEHRKYELARENLLELLDHHELPEARRLLRLVDAQLALQQTRTQDVDAQVPELSASSERRRAPAELLDRDAVNLIRVYEVDFDNPPRMTVQPDTIRRLFENYGTNEVVPATQRERNALLRGDPTDLVRLMFTLRARELYPEIQVDTEPHSLNMFRLRVHNTWLLNNCATSGCHGGPEAGDLYLHRRGYADERVRYTNFMILEQLEVDPEWPLINYTDPEMSLIVQYGLPREVARLPHPDVRGWEPVFVRTNDRMKRDTLRWIESMMLPRPHYPIDFDPTPRWVGGPDDPTADPETDALP